MWALFISKTRTSVESIKYELGRSKNSVWRTLIRVKRYYWLGKRKRIEFIIDYLSMGITKENSWWH